MCRTKKIALLLALILVGGCCFPFHSFAVNEMALSHGNREERTIALTFDDGPHPRYTPQILALLEAYNIRGTFFMIGKNISFYPEMAKEVFRAGHEIGSHTFTHPHMLKIDAAHLREELLQTEKALSALGIPKPILFRPPEGYRTREQIACVKNAGYRMVVWSLDTHDWKSKPSDEIVSYVLSHVKGGDILLFHDYISGQNTTIAALEELIPQLLEDGYQFVTVSELMR